MKTLVTGGAGFIGSHLVDLLVLMGDEVVVLDNFSTGKRENIRGSKVRLIEGDIRDDKCVSEAVKGVDTVFHQAALCSVARSIEDPQTTHEVNANGTLNVLEASRKAGVRRVLMASSSSVYGDSEVSPKHEGLNTSPLSPYAVSKLIGEIYCQMYWKTFGLETVALRYFNVFGPRQDPGSEYSAVIPKFLQTILRGEEPNIYGDGTQSRDFTFVKNVVRANVAAAISPKAAGQVMNIACGDSWSLLQLLDKLEDILGIETKPVFLPRRLGDVWHSQACMKRAADLIGFSPMEDFETGLQQTVDWFLASTAVQRFRFQQRRMAPEFEELGPVAKLAGHAR